jgi:hypothetical protein
MVEADLAFKIESSLRDRDVPRTAAAGRPGAEDLVIRDARQPRSCGSTRAPKASMKARWLRAT